MDEIGGHELTVMDGDRQYVCTVSEGNRDKAVRLALAHVGGDRVTGGTELWESDISALGMQPNEVKAAIVVMPRRDG